jgi:hypothetical protein
MERREGENGIKEKGGENGKSVKEWRQEEKIG